MGDVTACMTSLRSGELIVSVPRGALGAHAIEHLRTQGGREFGCSYLESLPDRLNAFESRYYVEDMRTQFHLVRVPDGEESSAINRIRAFYSGETPAHGRITSVEPNVLLSPSPSEAIGLPFTLGGNHAAYLRRMNHHLAESTGSGVSVAVIDTGLDASARVGPATMHDINLRPVALSACSDADGHGTAMATLIHAVAPDAQTSIVRAFDASGVLPCWHLMAAIPVAAFECKADIINMSFGYKGFPVECSMCGATQPARLNAYDLMLDGIENHPIYTLDSPIYVVSTGNDAATGGFDFPAFHASSVAVGAVNSGGGRSSFSNYGSIGHAQHVMAPGGEELPGTGVAENVGTGPTGTPCRGTSVAAAYTSGMLAVLRSDSRYNHMTRARFMANVLLHHTTLTAGQSILEYGSGQVIWR